jgi:nitrate reductase NapAB chaperone NapD
MSICCDELGQVSGKKVIGFQDKVAVLLSREEVEYDRAILKEIAKVSDLPGIVQIWLLYKNSMALDTLGLIGKDEHA